MHFFDAALAKKREEDSWNHPLWMENCFGNILEASS